MTKSEALQSLHGVGRGCRERIARGWSEQQELQYGLLRYLDTLRAVLEAVVRTRGVYDDETD